MKLGSRLENNQHYPIFNRHLLYKATTAGLTDAELLLLLILRFATYDQEGPKKCQLFVTESNITEFLGWSPNKSHYTLKGLLKINFVKRIKNGLYFINEEEILNFSNTKLHPGRKETTHIEEETTPKEEKSGVSKGYIRRNQGYGNKEEVKAEDIPF